MSYSNVSNRTAPLLEAIEDVEPLAETIWSNLAAMTGIAGHKRILFTSTDAQSGTSLIAAATACGLARNTRSQVTLVETHLARPATAGYLGLEESPGFSDLLVGAASLDACLQHVPGCQGLTVLPAGAPRPVAAGEFVAPGALDMFDTLAARTPFVIFDAPPLLEHAETRALLRHVDGVVLVLRARESRKAAVRRTLERIEEAGVRVYGSVLNRFKRDLPFGPG